MSYADEKALEVAQKRMDEIVAAHELKLKAEAKLKKPKRKFEKREE